MGHNEWDFGPRLSVQASLFCCRTVLKNDSVTNFFPNWKKKENIKSIQNDVMWCYFVSAHCAFVLTQRIEKDIPFGCCLIGSLPVTRLIWRSLNAACTCDQSGSKHPDDKVTRSVKAAYKQACPLPDRKLGAAEALPCLICQQRSLPPRLITAAMSDGVHNSALDGCFDFSLCDTSVACHVALCLSASWARPGQMCSSSFCPVFTNRGSRPQTSQHGTHHVEGQEAVGDTTCTPVQLVSQSISPAANARRVGCGMWVLCIKRCIMC